MQQQDLMLSNAQILAQYQVSPEFGFLPAEAPLLRLPSYFEPWEKLANQLSSLLQAGAFRKFAEQMPTLSIDDLQTSGEQERGLLLLSMFGHSFHWEHPDGSEYLPECIAKPWSQLAE